MADLSKITLPSGTTYNIKDAQAREDIAAIQQSIASGVHFVGNTTTALTDGATTNPITIGGDSYTAKAGDLVTHGDSEFLWDGTKWVFFGDFGSLGDLAFKDSASGSYKPAGTVSKPTFTGSSSTFTGKFTPEGTIGLKTSNKTAAVSVASSGTSTYTPEGTVGAPDISLKTAGTTTTIKNPTSQTVAKTVVVAAPGATAPANALTYYAVSGETLSLYQLGYTTGASITTANVTVKNGDAEYEATAPNFSGTGVRLVTGNIAVPTSASFTGTEGDVSTSGTPSGSVSQPTFTGTQATITVS